MKDNILQQLISDPDFDPTAWLGTAIKDYIADNPYVVLTDSVCFKYVLKAMDSDDWINIARNMPADPNLFNKFINKMQVGDDDRRLMQAARVLVERVQNSLSSPSNPLPPPGVGDLALTLLNINDLKTVPNGTVFGVYNDLQVMEAIEKWNTVKWNAQTWAFLIKNMNACNLEKLVLNPKFPKKLCADMGYRNDCEGGRVSRERVDQISWVQDVLVCLIFKLPHEHLHIWPDVLKRFTPEVLSIAYHDYHPRDRRGRSKERTKDERLHRQRIVSKSDGYYGDTYASVHYEPRFTDLMCRCGYMTNNKSAYKLHNKKCLKRNRLSLGLLSRLWLARCGITTGVCQKCGRKCSTKSGLTLHMKKCTVEITEYDLQRVGI